MQNMNGWQQVWFQQNPFGQPGPNFGFPTHQGANTPINQPGVPTAGPGMNLAFGQTHHAAFGGAVGSRQPEEVHPRQDEQIAPEQRPPIPIPPQRQTSQTSATSDSPTGVLGPMSSTITVPRRPKPGRKPIQHEDAADRRRMQNRVAQRNFRDKRTQKLAEVSRSLEENKKSYERDLGDSQRELESLKTRVTLAERRLEEEKKARLKAEEELQKLRYAQQYANGYNLFRDSHGAAVDTPGHLGSSMPPASMGSNQAIAAYHNHPTPPSDDMNDHPYATDFTNWGRSQRPDHLRQMPSNESVNLQWDSSTMNVDNTEDRCGFCTDARNCLCKQNKPETSANANNAASEAGCSAGGAPGSCSRCRSDPQFAQRCRDLKANGIEFQQNNGYFTATSAQEASALASAFPTRDQRMSCADFIDMLNNDPANRNASISELFGGRQFRGFPSLSGTAFDIERVEAAAVLSRMSMSAGTRRGEENRVATSD